MSAPVNVAIAEPALGVPLLRMVMLLPDVFSKIKKVPSRVGVAMPRTVKLPVDELIYK